MWAELTDVGRWPDWTDSMTSVTLLDRGPLRVGSRARIKQPGMPAMTWQVTELVEGESFTWVSGSPGLRTTGTHRLTADGDGTTRLTLAIHFDGPLAGLVGRLFAGRTRRYLRMEADGLKAASEGAGTLAGR